MGKVFLPERVAWKRALNLAAFRNGTLREMNTPCDVRNEFGKNLRAARIRAGLTQARVADRTRLTQPYVSLVEAGRQNITLSTMTALAKVIGHQATVVLRKAPGSRNE
jgi:DNA-binding XRE family transcriptional regulator